MPMFEINYMDDGRLENRALNACFREATRLLNRDGVHLPQPSRSGTEVIEEGGSRFVVLRNCNGVLAEYRWDGKRLRKVT